MLLLGLLAMMLVVPSASVAAPPSNDNFADAAVIADLPFGGAVDISQATVEPAEPIADQSRLGRTVWYSFTPTADAVVTTARPISPPDPSPPSLCSLRSSQFLVIYRADGPGFAGLTQVAGSQWSNNMANTLHVLAGATYYFQGGQNGGLGESDCPPFILNVAAVPPPPNDDFADASTITSVPFSDSRDLTAATLETGEPTPCGNTFTQSTWYAFTPAISGTYGGYPSGNVNVYTGTSVDELTTMACSTWNGLYFHGDAGTTYYLQAYGSGGIRVNSVPPPLVAFIYSPVDPSTIDQVSFSYWTGGYWDPTVTGQSWDFGDGTTATGSTASHSFVAPGDYVVSLTVTALGERTASKSQVVHVVDRTPPVLSLPNDQVVGATNATGAVVVYAVTADDNSQSNPTIVCTPASGSLFPLGSTTVGCTATDASGNASSGAFTVTVKGAAEQLADLAVAVSSVGPGVSLADKIADAQWLFAHEQLTAGCSKLTSFTLEVRAQWGKAIESAQAASLTDDAIRIKGVLGCAN